MSALRVVVATPLPEELCRLVEQRVPGVELVRDQALLPPQRWPADFAGDPSFVRTADEQGRFEALLASAHVLYGIPDTDPAALARTVAANPELRWVQIMAAGGGAQVRAAGLAPEDLERVVFTTGAGVHAGPLSEFALFGLLCGDKHLPRLVAQQSRHEWSGRWPLGQVAGSTVVVAGLGGIGREVVRKAHALGARVVGVSRSGEPVPGADVVGRPRDLVELAHGADALVSTLPGADETTGLVSAAVLDALRPGATFVSVGRGTVVDEPALVDALRSGQVGFAALDVFAVEPLPADSPLWDLPNVVVSPHTAANSPHEERLLAELFCGNLERFLAGRPLRNVVDTVRFV